MGFYAGNAESRVFVILSLSLDEKLQRYSLSPGSVNENRYSAFSIWPDNESIL
jgi:hypothetical protein